MKRRIVSREEIRGDLHELFRSRVLSRGRAYARIRYLVDLLSLWLHGTRDSWITHTRPSRWPAEGVRDIGYAARLFAARPGPPLVAVVGLALAIGIGTSIFSVLNAVALRPLGVPDPDSVMRVMQTADHSISTSWTYADALDLREHSAGVPLEVWMDMDGVEFASDAHAERPARVRGRLVGGAYFQVLQGRAGLGRLLEPADDATGAAPAIVVSYPFWSRELGADPAVIGRRIWLNGSACTIVGVTARTFSDAVDRPPSFWIPVGARTQLVPGSLPLNRLSDATTAILARVPRAMSASAAESSVSAIAAAIAVQHDGTNAPAGAGARFERLDSRFSGSGAAGRVVAVGAIVMTIALIVLLAYANVTNLLLASATARAREIAVRLALGATRGRLIRQLLTESVLLGAAGGTLGLLAATWGLPLLLGAIRAPDDLDVTFDVRVYMFLTLVSIVAGVAAGLAPARHGTRADIASPLKRGDTGSVGRASPWWLRSTLLGVQAAASVVLLILAALLTRSAIQATSIDLGIPADRLLTLSPSLGNHGYNPATASAFWDGELRRVRELPGIEAAALVRDPPFGDGSMVEITKRQGRGFTVFFNEVSAGYLEALELTILRGRTFSEDDVRMRANVVVLSEAAAREFWKGEDPIGAPFDRVVAGSEPPRIIGIVRNAVTEQVRDADHAAVYALMSAETLPRASLVVRTAGNAAAVTIPLRELFRAADPNLRPSVTMIGERAARQLSEPRALATVAGTLGLVALALASIGIYGVAAVMVIQRAPEIGVRMAMGATLQNVLIMLLRETLRPVGIGLAAGALAALGAAQLMSNLLFGIKTYDPVALSSAILLLGLTATAAVIMPARRAARVDPATVLRA